MLATLVHDVDHAWQLRKRQDSEKQCAMLAKELPYLVLMAKHAANTAKEIERRLPIASELRVFGILMITPLVSFKSNHGCGDTLCGCEVDSDSGYVC